VRDAIRANLALVFPVTEPDGTPNPNVDFGFNIKDVEGNPVGEVAWSDVFNVIRDTPGVRKMGDARLDLTLNGLPADVKLNVREFPVLRHGDAAQRRHGGAALMALLNPTFADAGALPGEAARWTISAVTSLEVLAAFGGAGREDFERWSAFHRALADVTVVRAFFDSRDGFEAFERRQRGVPLRAAARAARHVAPSGGAVDVRDGLEQRAVLRDWRW
jgi:hypothetical protein